MSDEPATPGLSFPPALATSWIDHIKGINALGESILTSGWKPTAILGISRGGLVLAAMLSYMLDVRNVHTVRVEHYDDQNKRLLSGARFLDDPQPFASINLTSERLLIVDAIVDTGETLKLVRQAAQDHAEQIKVAALYVRPNQQHAADWYWKVDDEWIIFPWAPED